MFETGSSVKIRRGWESKWGTDLPLSIRSGVILFVQLERERWIELFVASARSGFRNQDCIVSWIWCISTAEDQVEDVLARLGLG